MKPKLNVNYREFMFADPEGIEETITVRCFLNSDDGDDRTPPFIDLDNRVEAVPPTLDEDTLKFMLAAIKRVNKLIKEEK